MEKGIKLTICRSSNAKDISEELIKFENEFGTIEVITSEVFHDRYLIIDRHMMYSLGTSLNNMGKKIFSIHKVNDYQYLQLALDKINTKSI